jgi:hypothetical protein
MCTAKWNLSRCDMSCVLERETCQDVTCHVCWTVKLVKMWHVICTAKWNLSRCDMLYVLDSEVCQAVTCHMCWAVNPAKRDMLYVLFRSCNCAEVLCFKGTVKPVRVFYVMFDVQKLQFYSRHFSQSDAWDLSLVSILSFIILGLGHFAPFRSVFTTNCI